MAQAYRQSGRAEEEAVFHLFFRRNPFGGGFAVACGLARALDYLAGFHFTAEDVAYLGSLEGNDGRPLFDPAFLRELGELRIACDVDAVPEGTVVFPYEPLVRVKGKILHAQLVETALLNFLNFETLIATKAARVVPGRAGRRGDRLRPAPGAGPRRRALRLARGLRGGRVRDVERPRRPPVRAAGARHARPQLGDGVRHRGRGLRGLGPGAAEQLRLPRGHLRHPGGGAARGGGGPAAARARARGRSGSASTPATSRTSASRRARSSTRPGSSRSASWPATTSTSTRSRASRSRGRGSTSGAWGRAS